MAGQAAAPCLPHWGAHLNESAIFTLGPFEQLFLLPAANVKDPVKGGVCPQQPEDQGTGLEAVALMSHVSWELALA